MRMIGYARVSTDKQSERGVSLPAQTERLRAAAIVHGAELIDIVVEGESGKNLNRPGLRRILAMVAAREVDCVVVCKLDRITRSVRDLGNLLEIFQKHGVALVSLAESVDTASASGRLVTNLLGSISQFEREITCERTRDALAHKRSCGLRAGTLRYGTKLAADGLHVEADPSEQDVISRIKLMRECGMTLALIAGRLNHDGVSTRRGTQWRLEYVHSILAASKVAA